MRIKAVFHVVALLLLSTISATAANFVKVSDNKGNATYFKVSAKPTVTFTTNQLVIKTSDETVEYSLSDYRKFEFVDENEATGISAMNADNHAITFSFDDSVKGEGLKPGSKVIVARVNGQAIGSAIADANGSIDIPLQGQHGVFIVNSSSKTFKFIKK